jgi:hypothetical protein
MKPANHFWLELPELVSEPPVSRKGKRETRNSRKNRKERKKSLRETGKPIQSRVRNARCQKQVYAPNCRPRSLSFLHL